MRRAVGALILIAALASLLPASAAFAEGAATAANGSALGTLGQALLDAVVRDGGAEEALSSMGASLAMVEARQRIAAEEAQAAQAPPRSEPEEITDPSRMPPASAGTNGTIDPNKVAADGKVLFAHARAESTPGSSNAILA